ncbi:MAG: peptidoglycan DD-metalloendopeptidase family protein [Burkholderiales bacterium]
MTLHGPFAHSLRLFFCCLAAALLVGCATSRAPAPVEDRSAAGAKPATAAASSTTAATPEAPKPPPGIENAGKPGYYTIKPGDTLIRIGLETGQNWRDIQKWNNLDNPNVVEVGQVLRVVAPGLDPGTAASRPVTTSRVESRTLEGAKPVAATPAASGPVPAASATPPAASSGPSGPSMVPTPSTTAPVREGDDELSWGWPAQGAMISGFDETRNKGIAIAGKAGDPVQAAADGRVVYAGSGLRGYGNLVIIKHNDTFLTAYAHNQTLLVKEDQPVRRGQKIAEMGSSDADRVQLHFEVRRRGKPVDPTRLLPAR